MPIQAADKKYYDFEEIFFEKNCDIDYIVNTFFTKHDCEIKGDKEYIKYKMKKLIEEDRKFITRMNCNGQVPIIGKVSYLEHYVIPEQNNGKEHYVYCIHSFI